jgi:hypothetical protein
METRKSLVSPQELYHAVWRAARACFYERSRLEGWHYWEHRFDRDMRDDEDAYRFIREMLSSLSDNYTYLKTPQVVRHDDAELAATPPPVWSRRWKNGIGYVKIDTFAHNDLVDSFRRELEAVDNSAGFIIDLRGNRGGFLDAANNCMQLVSDSGPLMISHKWSLNGNWDERVGYLTRYKQGFRSYDRDGKETGCTEWDRKYRNIIGHRPLVVLIDGTTASSAELFAGILGDNEQATLIGRETAGKGIGQDTFDMPNGCALKITDCVFLPPSRQWFGDDAQTYRNGCKPHLYVRHDPNYRGDRIADVAFNHLSRLLNRDRRESNVVGLLGVAALGLLAAAAAGGRRRVA